MWLEMRASAALKQWGLGGLLGVLQYGRPLGDAATHYRLMDVMWSNMFGCGHAVPNLNTNFATRSFSRQHSPPPPPPSLLPPPLLIHCTCTRSRLRLFSLRLIIKVNGGTRCRCAPRNKQTKKVYCNVDNPQSMSPFCLKNISTLFSFSLLSLSPPADSSDSSLLLHLLPSVSLILSLPPGPLCSVRCVYPLSKGARVGTSRPTKHVTAQT